MKSNRDEKKKQGKTCNKLAAILKKRVEKTYGIDLDYGEIHGAWAKLPMGKHHKAASIENLKAKEAWLNLKLLEAKSGKWTKESIWTA